MIDVEFRDVQHLEMFLSEVAVRFSDFRGFWNDFSQGLLSGKLRAVFETEGFGTWVPLSPAYARAKAAAVPDRGILERSGTYLAATARDHPGNVYIATPLRLVYGVAENYFVSRFGENYPERHEFGLGVPMREVFGLVGEDLGLDAGISAQLDTWSTDEIGAAAAAFGF